MIRIPDRWRPLAAFLIVFAAYLAAARAGLTFALISGVATPVWPPSGLALAALLLGSPRVAGPAILLGAAAVNYGTGMPVPIALLTGVGNTLEGLAGAWLYRRVAGSRVVPERPTDLLALLLLAGAVACTLSATIGTWAIQLSGATQPGVAPRDIWLTWWVGDVLGVTLVAPFLLSWATGGWRAPSRRELVEGAALTAAVLLVGWIFFYYLGPEIGRRYPIPFLAFPLVAWAALRFGARGAMTTTAALCVFAVIGAFHDRGPFVASELNDRLLVVQAFIAVLATTGLALAGEISRRRRAETVLEASEARYRVLVDSAAEAIVVLDVDAGRFAEVNPAAELLFGRSRAELLALAPWDVSPPLQPNGQPSALLGRRHVEDALEGGAPVFEWVHRRADGADLACEVRLIRLPDPSRRLIRGTLTDIAERKRAEAAVAEGEARLRRVTDAVPGVVYRFERGADGTDRFTFMSRGVRDLFAIPDGADPGDAARAWQSVHPDDAPRVRDALDLSARTGGPLQCDYRVVRRDGRTAWVRTAAIPEPRRADGTRVWNGILLDIGAERRAAEFATAQREILEAIVAGAPVPSLLDRIARLVESQVPGSLGSILLVDREQRVLRHGAHASLPDALVMALDPMPIGPDIGACGTAAHTGRRTISADLERDPAFVAYLGLAREHGLRACWSTPFLGADGDVLGTLAVYFREVRSPTAAELELLDTAAHLAGICVQRARGEEALRTAEERLRHAEKMEAVGQLAGGVAHDFNNILTVISSSAELLAEQVPAGSELAEDVALIRDSAARAETLTRQLLAFSRRQPWQPRAVDLNGAIQRLEPMLARLAGEHVELDLRLGGDLPAIRADESQVEQVLVNLVVNARDAMPRGGRLSLTTRAVELGDDEARRRLGVAPGPYAVLVARDNGLGMDDATRRRIFEPFFTTKPAGKGTGLGLATVYAIVQRAGGTITVRSAPGEGAAFFVYLPLSPEAAAEAPVAREAPARAGGRGERVLLVEDEEMVRRLAARILRERGYDVTEAPNGAAALARLDTGERFDLLLTDVIMPGMNGRELRERVRDRRPAMPALYMSGYTDDTELLRLVREDGVPFLQKPFRPDDLAAAVRGVLDAP